MNFIASINHSCRLNFYPNSLIFKHVSLSVHNRFCNLIHKSSYKVFTHHKHLNSTPYCKSWQQLTKAFRQPKKLLVVKLGFFSGLVSLKTVHCESPRKDRLVGLDKAIKVTESKFDWSKLWWFIWPDILCLLGAIMSAFGVALINIEIPLLLGQIVNVVSNITVDFNASYTEEIKTPALKLLMVVVAQGILTFAYISLLAFVGERVASRMRTELFQNLIRQDVAFFDNHRVGEIISRLTSDVQDFKSAFKLCISQGLRSFAQTIGCVISLYIISPKMTGLMLIVIPSIIGIGALMGSILRKLSREAQAQVAKATAVADEALGNIRTVRSFAMETKEVEMFIEEAKSSCVMNEKLGIGIGIFQGMANIALNGIVLGVLYVGGSLITDSQMSAGNLMSFLVATQTIQRSLAALSLLFGQSVKGMSCGARVFEYLALEPTIPLTGGTKIPYHCLLAEVEFQNVSFTYPTRPNQVVLKDINLKLLPGRVVALCGPSGSGKSTLAILLERYYDVNNGQILLDGQNIKSLDPTWLRGKVIGFIHQEPILFATSIMENIRYGRPDASDKEVYEAASLANADEFIRHFPEGYHTIVGERGVTISGGQKQRIAIARALIKNPSILILDEATSALDAESERQVQEALDRVMKGRTVLVIAHRLSTIQNADLIVVLAAGYIQEVGTHAELKAKKGLYWKLIRQQELQDPETGELF